VPGREPSDRLTLTVPDEWGAIIVSFFTIVISTATVHLWGILAFLTHQIRADRSPHDGLYHQQQIILRNSRDSWWALWQISKMSWYWKGHSDRVIRRTSPLVILCGVLSAGFLAASLFSSRLISSSDEVLIRSPQCGWMEDYPLMMKIGSAWIPTQRQLDASNALAISARYSYRRSATYVRSCYVDQPGSYSSLCGTFIKQKIDSTTRTNQPCPFPSDVCAAGTHVLDSGHINSDLDLGLSSHPEDRISIRRVSSAVPLRIEKYVTDWMKPSEELLANPDLTANETYKFYYLGPKITPPLPYTWWLAKSAHVAATQAYGLL